MGVLMGLFDKLFKKKTPTAAPVRSIPPKNVARSAPPTSKPRPPSGQTRVRSSPVTRQPSRNISSQQNISQAPFQQPSISDNELDAEARRILEESIAKIPRATPATANVKQPPSSPTSEARLGSPVATPIAKRQPVEKAIVSKPPVSEDKLGEEELFKKLVQMDKELQQKVVTRKVKTPITPITPTPPPIEKPKEKKKVPLSEKDLRKKARALRKLEVKLREKEKKLKEKEDMNKMFSSLQDSELEQISNAPTIDSTSVGEISGGEVAGVRVTEDGRVIPVESTDFEDLLQPLKNLIFNNFIVGPSNRFAHDVALSVAKAPADAYNPLFIYSSVGLGKTHLLCAIGNYIKAKNPKAKIVYASSEKFTNELLDYLRLGEMEKFRIKYRSVDVLLIDDIQFIGGQEGTQEEFFHTFNALYNAHKQIVITSDRPPKNIAHLKDRLRSRFEGGLIVNIKLPDLGTRTMILHEKAEKDGIYIPDEIINYIAAKVKSNVRTLIGVLNRIVAHSSLSDRELDKTLVDDVLQDVTDEGLNISGL
jgi:chromosomal replication initiator protein DnaA